jgi:autotransporter-associated beta strand protein
LVLASAGTTFAVDLYWDLNGNTSAGAGGATPSGSWNAANWNSDSAGLGLDPAGAWQPNQTAVFSAGSDATGSYTITVGSPVPLSGLRFEEGSVTVSGSALQFSGGAAFRSSSSADCPINSLVQGNGVLTLEGSGYLARLNGVVSDSGGTLSVAVKGAGWVFGGQHAYTGDTTVENGIAIATVSSTGNASLGTLTSGPFGRETLVLKGGTLRPTSGADITIGNAVTLDGNFTLGTVDSMKSLTFAGPLALTGNRTLTCTSSHVIFGGVLGETASFGLTKSGTATLTLGASNTFAGGITIDNGTVALANTGALNATSPNAVSFASNANTKKLQLGGNSVTVAGLSTGTTVGSSTVENGSTVAAVLTVNNAVANTFAGVLQDGATGSLALTKTGAGTLTLSGSSANSSTGLTTVGAGTLSLAKTGNVNAISGDVQIAGGTLSLAGANQIADTSNITVNSGSFTTATNVDRVRNVTINSPNECILSNLTVTETLEITAGTTTLNSNTLLTNANALVMSGNSLVQLAANGGPTILTVGSGGLAMSGATLQLGMDPGAYAAQVNLGGAFTGSGTNTVRYFNANASRFLDLQGGVRVFSITDGTTTVTPSIQNGGLTKTGVGTLTLSGAPANTYTGLTTVAAGTLKLAKSGSTALAGDVLVTGGTLSLGASHQIADTANLTITGGTLQPDAYADTLHDLTISSASECRLNNLTVGGTLTVSAGLHGMASGASFTANAVRLTGGTLWLAGNTRPRQWRLATAAWRCPVAHCNSDSMGEAASSVR